MTVADPLPARRRKTFRSLIAGAPEGRVMRAGPREAALTLLLSPDRDAMGRRNRLSNFAFYLLAAVGGSAASVAAALLASWALISVLLGRFRWRLEPSDRPVALSSLLFFVVLSTSAFVHGSLAGSLAKVGAFLPFLTPLLLIPRMRLSRLADTLPPAFFGSAVGGALLIPIVVAEHVLVSERVEGLAGNSGPFSVMGLLCAGWSLLYAAPAMGRRHLLLAALGVVGGSLAVMLSGMRGSWPALPLCLAIALFSRRRELLPLWKDASVSGRGLLLGAAGAILALLAVVVWPMIAHRLDEMWQQLALIAANVESPTSLNLRKEMYEAAVRAIAVRPWLGYGPEGHWNAVAPYLNRATFQHVSFTHFHNVILTVGVDAGLVGIAAFAAAAAAPVWTALRARRTAGGARRLAASLILLAAFLLPGMTNIMFFHDILDAVWVFSVSLIAASVPAGGGEARTGDAAEATA